MATEYGWPRPLFCEYSFYCTYTNESRPSPPTLFGSVVVWRKKKEKKINHHTTQHNVTSTSLHSLHAGIRTWLAELASLWAAASASASRVWVVCMCVCLRPPARASASARGCSCNCRLHRRSSSSSSSPAGYTIGRTRWVAVAGSCCLEPSSGWLVVGKKKKKKTTALEARLWDFPVWVIQASLCVNWLWILVRSFCIYPLPTLPTSLKGLKSLKGESLLYCPRHQAMIGSIALILASFPVLTK